MVSGSVEFQGCDYDTACELDAILDNKSSRNASLSMSRYTGRSS